MTVPQDRSLAALPGAAAAGSRVSGIRNHTAVGRTALRYASNKWCLLAAGGVVLIGIAAFSWSWLVAAGIASILVSVLPCLVMCGLGLCMCKFMGSSGSARVSGSAVANPPKDSAQTEANEPAAYAASCCGAGAFVSPAKASATVDTKENTDA